MNKMLVVSLTLILAIFLSASLTVAQQEVEPNNFFSQATPILDNTETSAMFTSPEDVDIFKIDMSTDNIYHIYSDSSDLPNDIHIEMFFEADTTLNILNGSPDGRAGWGDFRLADWAPFQYGNGTY